MIWDDGSSVEVADLLRQMILNLHPIIFSLIISQYRIYDDEALAVMLADLPQLSLPFPDYPIPIVILDHIRRYTPARRHMPPLSSSRLSRIQRKLPEPFDQVVGDCVGDRLLSDLWHCEEDIIIDADPDLILALLSRGVRLPGSDYVWNWHWDQRHPDDFARIYPLMQVGNGADSSALKDALRSGRYDLYAAVLRTPGVRPRMLSWESDRIDKHVKLALQAEDPRLLQAMFDAFPDVDVCERILMRVFDENLSKVMHLLQHSVVLATARGRPLLRAALRLLLQKSDPSRHDEFHRLLRSAEFASRFDPELIREMVMELGRDDLVVSF